MQIETIDAIAEELEDLQEEYALTDPAVAAAIQLFVRTGELPEGISEEDSKLQSGLLRTAWLLFVAAPALHPRYLLVSSMHLNLVISGDHPLENIFDELRDGVDGPSPGEDQPRWLDEYRSLGDAPMPKEPDEIQRQFETARKLLREHHEEVLDFTRKVLDELASQFDRHVAEGNLSPLGSMPDVEFDDADRAIEEARRLQADGDLQGAVYIYSQALKLRPDDVNALVHRGILRGSLEDLSGACEDFDRALALDDEHLVARLNRALARHSLGQIKEALRDYDMAIEQVDDDPEIWTNRGIARFSAHDLEGALHDLNRAIELDDNLAVAYLHRGNVYRVRKEVGYALKDYEKAIELAPRSVDGYAARAYLHLQLGSAKEAIADFDRAIELQSADPTLYYNRAHAHLVADDLPAAIADYDRALQLDPEDVEALSNRGAAHMMAGDLDAAIADWEDAIAIDPYYPTAYLKRASMWIATEQPEEAARDLQIALDNAPTDWPYREDVEQTLEEILEELGFDQPD